MNKPRDTQPVHGVVGSCLTCKQFRYIRVLHGHHNGVPVGICTDCDNAEKEGDDGIHTRD